MTPSVQSGLRQGLTIATVTALIGIGYAVGAGQSSNNVTYLENRLQSIERDYDRATDLNLRLKHELISATPGGNVSPHKLQPNESTVKANTGAVTVTLSQGQTETIDSGSLFVSLHATSFEGSPLRNRVFGTIGSGTGETKPMNGLDPGAVIEVFGYRVRVLSTGTVTATFFVERTSTAPDQ